MQNFTRHGETIAVDIKSLIWICGKFYIGKSSKIAALHSQQNPPITKAKSSLHKMHSTPNTLIQMKKWWSSSL